VKARRRIGAAIEGGAGKRWSRRAFLRAGVGGTLVVGAAFVPGWAWGAIPVRRSALSGPERETLRLVVDELIPRGADRPPASEVGALAYLEERATVEEAFAGELARLIGALDEAARVTRQGPFPRLAEGERVALLRDLERASADAFAGLRDAVYEAYYTQPAVWERIGYEFHAGVDARPAVERFDESVLASARTLPRWYREAP
jgi:hypothetical protein